MNWWNSVRKIATLPNVKLTPTVVLARTLEKAQRGRIRSVYIGIEWEANEDGKENVFVHDWSSMPPTSLAAHAMVADITAKRLFHADID
jgi:hypothetical protein